jgi:hypothetical protein
MKNLFVLTIVIGVAASCTYTNGDFPLNAESKKNFGSTNVPCEQNKEVVASYNNLVDSLQKSFSFDKSFEELSHSLIIAEKIKKLQEDSECLIHQNSRIQTIKTKCIELKKTTELLNKEIQDEDLMKRVSFYNKMIITLDGKE